MNLPEYRRAVKHAQDQFQKAVLVAAESLEQNLAAVDREFFEGDETRQAARPDEGLAVREERRW